MGMMENRRIPHELNAAQSMTNEQTKNEDTEGKAYSQNSRTKCARMLSRAVKVNVLQLRSLHTHRERGYLER